MSTTKKVSKDLINLRFDKATSVLFKEFSRTKLKEWILSGNILLNGEIASPREKVSLDDEIEVNPINEVSTEWYPCLLYTSPSPRDKRQSRMPSSA